MDTIKFQRDLVTFLEFINHEPRKNDGISLVYTWLEIDTVGAASVRSVSGTPAIRRKLETRMSSMVQSLNFKPAYLLKKPEKKVPFRLTIDIYVGRDAVRFLLAGDGRVKYMKAYFKRPIK